MKMLVGNHIDPAIRDRADLRAWTQRILWFAQAGDVVVLCDDPDPEFLAYATAHTGVDPSSLRVLVPPPGRYGRRLLDPDSLADEAFLRRVKAEVTDAVVSEVFALWPSAAVTRFAGALGLADVYPGSGFIGQGGGELVNNKAVFRMLATAADVAVPAGRVARDQHEAISATSAMLASTGAAVVKQAHNGAGVGNQLLITDSAVDLGHVGARHLHILHDRPGAIEDYWAQRWAWASADDRFPVVVEEFTPHVASLYSEHALTDAGTEPTEMGTLVYVGRRLSHQIVPFRGDQAILEQLLAGGARLAQTWRALGYRGQFSADAVLTPDGRVVFTEVNAQVSGSLHIYDVIAHRIVDTAADPQRSVVEYHVPPTWAVPDLTTFLAAAAEIGCSYDPGTRTGVIVSMPAIALQPGRAQFVFCLAYATDADRDAAMSSLDKRFAAVPADAYTAADHVGVPAPEAV